MNHSNSANQIAERKIILGIAESLELWLRVH